MWELWLSVNYFLGRHILQVEIDNVVDCSIPITPQPIMRSPTSFIAPKRSQYRDVISLLPLDPVISGGDSQHCYSILLLRGKGMEPVYLSLLRVKQPTQEAMLLLSFLLCDIMHLLFVPIWMVLLTAKCCANYGSKSKSIHGASAQLVESRLNFLLGLDSLDWMKTDLRSLPWISFELTKNGKLIPVRWELFQDYNGALRTHGETVKPI